MRMKAWVAAVLLMACLGTLNGQQCPTETTIDQENTASVDAALFELKAGLFSSIAAKGLERLGDEASDTALRNHTLQELSTEPMMVAVARMIAISFSGPSMIINEKDKTPKMSVLLLNYLRLSAHSPDTIREIDTASEALAKQSRAQSN